MLRIEYNLVNTVPRLAEIKRAAESVDLSDLKQCQNLIKEIDSIVSNLNLKVNSPLEHELTALSVQIQTGEINQKHLVHKLGEIKDLAIRYEKLFADALVQKSEKELKDQVEMLSSIGHTSRLQLPLSSEKTVQTIIKRELYHKYDEDGLEKEKVPITSESDHNDLEKKMELLLEKKMELLNVIFAEGIPENLKRLYLHVIRHNDQVMQPISSRRHEVLDETEIKLNDSQNLTYSAGIPKKMGPHIIPESDYNDLEKRKELLNAFQWH